MTYSALFLPEFDVEVGKTRKILERIPEEHFGYRPHAKSMVLDRLATHVAELPSWPHMILKEQTTEIPPDFEFHIPTSRAALLERLDKSADEGRAAIEAATDEEWAKTWTLIWAGQKVLEEVRSTVMRNAIMNHLVHHRAQVGVYLRMLDVPIPGLY